MPATAGLGASHGPRPKNAHRSGSGQPRSALLQGKAIARYSITSIDNNSIGAGGSSSKRGEFDDADAALARAEQLVNGALQDLLPTASDARELMAHYMVRGSEVTMIYCEPRVTFHAFRYARTRANELFATAVVDRSSNDPP